jgi:hypothetical protein
VALSLCLVGGGCRSATDVASEKANLILPGMTRKDVLRTLGEPDGREVRSGKEPVEIWNYKYGQGLDPDPGRLLVGVIAFIGVVALAFATCSSGSLASLAPQDDYCGLQIEFEAKDGLVQGISLKQ